MTEKTPLQIALRRKRYELHFTQQQMADHLGITRASYCSLEGGKWVPGRNLVKNLVTIFHIPARISRPEWYAVVMQDSSDAPHS